MSKEAALAMATGVQPPTTPTETPPAATPTVPVVEDRASMLLKKEASLVRQQADFNKQRQEWEPKVKQADEILARAKQFEDTLKTDAIAALKLIGYDDTQIFNLMSKGAEAPKEKTPAEIAKEETERILKARDEEESKVRNEQQAKANEAAIFSGIARLKADPENSKKYTMLNRHGNLADQIVSETLKEFAKTMDPATITQESAEKLLAEACDSVETWYRDQFKSMVETNEVVEILQEMGFTKAQAQAAAAAVETKTEEVIKPTLPNQSARPRPQAVTNTNGSIPQRETREQKKERLMKSLATGDKSLLRN